MYSEDWITEGVIHRWYRAIVHDSIRTHRGTLVDMIHRPEWGMACYMDNAIQSCEVDEALYHEALVHPAMSSTTKRVLIVGGGEGATAREVLKWQNVEHVDMYEWDQDVIQLFQQKYPQWAKGAWKDPRLHMHVEDIFQVIQSPPKEPYDAIIVDLFDPSEENKESWAILLSSIKNWLHPRGSIVYYAGIRSILMKEQPYQMLLRMIELEEAYRRIIPYHVCIPSFSGEAVFILCTYESPTFVVPSHLTSEIWKSYGIFNW
jgi:spermidine synthase